MTPRPPTAGICRDIHVRTYSGAEKFSRSIAYRPTPDSEPKMTKETAFHARIGAKTRNLVEYKGYWLPQVYSSNGAIEEYWACRQAAVVLDLSPLRKFEVTGPDAEALMQWVLTRDMKKLSPGPGGLFRDVLRPRRHDRRRHAVPAGPRQFPLDRRR